MSNPTMTALLREEGTVIGPPIQGGVRRARRHLARCLTTGRRGAMSISLGKAIVVVLLSRNLYGPKAERATLRPW